jgi:hypothetical protein
MERIMVRNKHIYTMVRILEYTNTMERAWKGLYIELNNGQNNMNSESLD